MKTCSKCKQQKEIDLFPIAYGRKRKDGTRKKQIRCECKECRGIIFKKWRDKHPGYGTIKKKEWENKNVDYIKEYRKKYKSDNRERCKKWKNEWDKKNYDWILEYKRNRYPEIKDKVRGWNNKTCAKMRENLSDCYVIYTLSRRIGKTAEFIRKYPELIEAQRLIIKTKRLCKTLQN